MERMIGMTAMDLGTPLRGVVEILAPTVGALSDAGAA